MTRPSRNALVKEWPPMIRRGKPFSDSLDDATAQSLYSVGLVRADGYMETLYLHNELGHQLLTLLNAE